MAVCGMDLTEEQMKRMHENRAAALAKRQKRSSEPPFEAVPAGSCIQLLARVPERLVPAETRAFASSCGSRSMYDHEGKEVGIARNSEPILDSSRTEGSAVNRKWHGSVSRDSGNHGETPTAHHQLEVVLELISAQHFTVTGCCVGGIRCLEGECVADLVKKLSSTHPSILLSNSRVISFGVEYYEPVVKVLSKLPGVLMKPVPLSTRMALKLLSKNTRGCSTSDSGPCLVGSEVIEDQLLSLPQKLKEHLLPFQWEGVRYGLRRHGRCLLADEMGVGKTIQAIAIASCYRHEGSVLVVCPASMRLLWAEELERWLPFLAPNDVHLVFGRKDDLVELEELPKFVVVSYTMLRRLSSTFSSLKWAMVIVDESHNLRTTKQPQEREETTAVLNAVKASKRAVLLSGTPSLTRPFDIFNQVDCLRPGLLGRSKYEFARHYCAVKQGFLPGKDYSKGSRLQELNVLLRETIMVRRLKDEVLSQLPPKRRQIIRLQLDKADFKAARALLVSLHQMEVTNAGKACRCGFTEKGFCECEEDVDQVNSAEECHEENDEDQSICRRLSYQEIGLAKLKGVRDWLLNYPIFICSSTDTTNSDDQDRVMKIVVFGHHRAVLDGIQETVVQKGVGFVRVDGTTPPLDRQKAVDLFQRKQEIKVAIVSVTAGGVGLNFSAAQTVVFAELPKSASEMLQAEDRAHRRGQRNAVNVYIFCAKGTGDDTHWQALSKSLERVSTMTNGAVAAIPGLEVDFIFDGLESLGSDTRCQNSVQPMQPCESEIVLTDISQGAEGSKSCMDDVSGCSYSTIATSQHVPLQHHENHDCASEDGSNSQQSTEVVTDNEGQALSFDARFLMFEMSTHTGRVHLYSSLPQDSFTPKLLQENFKPEVLELYRAGGQVDRGALPQCILSSRVFQDAAMSFIAEWNALRAVHRKQLLGKPLRLPLSDELDEIRTHSTYAPGGLVKGGSKRRLAPREEVVCPVPEGATLKTVAFQTCSGPKEVLQAWSAEGDPLCKLCQTPCRGKHSRSPEAFVHLFCKKKCFERYCERTNPRYQREELFQLERGVCVECGLDCHDLVRCLISLPEAQRPAVILQRAPDFSKHKSLLDILVGKPTEGNAWHADHIVPVYEGGGECSIENLRTMCVVCHAKVTSDQSTRRHSLQRRTKESLKLTISKLIERSQRMRLQKESAQEVTASNASGERSDDDDDELLVEVAGSAYTETSTTSTELEHDVPTEPYRSDAELVVGAEQLLNDTSLEDELPGSASTENTAVTKVTASNASGERSDDDDDELSVEVAGSAYTETSTTSTELEHDVQTEPYRSDAELVVGAEQLLNDTSLEDELPGSASPENTSVTKVQDLENEHLASSDFGHGDGVGDLSVATGKQQAVELGGSRKRQWQLRRHSAAEHKSFSERMLASSGGDAFLEAYFRRRFRKDRQDDGMLSPLPVREILPDEKT